MNDPKRFDTMLKAFPKTKFIAHADTFWANMSANSCNNFLNRDPDFTAGFLPLLRRPRRRYHQPLPASPRKCIARETLAAARKMSKPEVFRKNRWENGARLLSLTTPA